MAVTPSSLLTRELRTLAEQTPLQILSVSDRGPGSCEIAQCTGSAKWYVEACSVTPEPYLPPVRYVCDRHILAAFAEVLESRRIRRERKS